MIRKLLTATVTGAALFVAFASSPTEAYGEPPTSKAVIECRSKCLQHMGSAPDTCGKSPQCAAPCNKETGNKESCKACVMKCTEPYAKATQACMQKCK